MQLYKKAFYNSLRFNFLKTSEIKSSSWQVEDLRERSLEELFFKLSNLGISIDKRNFIIYAKEYEKPECLTDLLCRDEKNYDKVYLIIFEIWRRIASENMSLSIFFDELDHRIYEYSNKKIKDEKLQDILASFLDILNENIDLGIEPSEIFQSISRYCAHDIEIFLYDYIFEKIEEGNDLYAYELIEDFYPFLSLLKWFDFLRIKIAFKKDVAVANDIVRNLFEELKEKKDVDLQIEVLSAMVQSGDMELFLEIVKKTVDDIEDKEDFLDVLEICVDFFRRLDLEEKEKEVKDFIKRYSLISKEKIEDTDKKDFFSIIKIRNYLQ